RSLVRALHELHLHAQLARRLLDLRQEEQVFDKAEDARRRVFPHLRRCPRERVGIVAAHVIAGNLNRRRRPVGHIAVHGAIAVVHGPNELPRTLLPAAALALLLHDAVAGLRLLSAAFLEEFLLLAALAPLPLVLILALIMVMLGRGRPGLRRRLHLRRVHLRRLATSLSVSLAVHRAIRLSGSLL